MLLLQTSAMAATVRRPSPHLDGGARQADQPVDTDGHCQGPGMPATWSDLVSLVVRHRYEYSFNGKRKVKLPGELNPMGPSLH